MSDVYYVYKHVHPGTHDEVVYVGYGKSHRAWIMDAPLRAKDHSDYLRGLSSLGFTPDDWVVIIAGALTREEALTLEMKHIKELRPRFNKNFSYPTKLSTEQVELAKVMKEDGMSYSATARELEVSTMTAYRAVKGETLAHS